MSDLKLLAGGEDFAKRDLVTLRLGHCSIPSGLDDVTSVDAACDDWWPRLVGHLTSRAGQRATQSK